MPRWLTNLAILLILGFIAVTGFLQIKYSETISATGEVAAREFALNTDGLVPFADWLASLPVTREATRSVSVLMVGDVMLSREVGRRMIRYGADYPFAAVGDYLRDADVTVANLESPIIDGAPVGERTMIFRADSTAAPALARAGIDIVNLANNHFMNQGARGALATFSHLAEAGIAYFGALADTGAGGNVLLIREVNDLKIGFLGYAYGPETDAATASGPGIVLMNETQLLADVTAARPQVDFLIVVMHAGVEYRPTASPAQESFAHAAIDAGADLVVGHHPHVVQNIEKYQGKYIFYSLGNFIFDQEWSIPTKQGLAVKFNLEKTGLRDFELQPIFIEDYARPRLLIGEEKDEFIEKLGIE